MRHSIIEEPPRCISTTTSRKYTSGRSQADRKRPSVQSPVSSSVIRVIGLHLMILRRRRLVRRRGRLGRLVQRHVLGVHVVARLPPPEETTLPEQRNDQKQKSAAADDRQRDHPERDVLAQRTDPDHGDERLDVVTVDGVQLAPDVGAVRERPDLGERTRPGPEAGRRRLTVEEGVDEGARPDLDESAVVASMHGTSVADDLRTSGYVGRFTFLNTSETNRKHFVESVTIELTHFCLLLTCGALHQC